MSAIPPAVAAIDVGSNAIRLAIARREPDGRYEIVHAAREPVRLGNDVFATGRIEEATMKAAIEAFGRFRQQLRRHSVSRLRAVATSAVREAENGEAFTAAVARRHRIGISVITPEEEARLVHLAVKEHVRLKGKPVLLVDIGGGSVEISLGNKNGIISTQSFAMGSVRLLRTLGQRRLCGPGFSQWVSRYADVTRDRLKNDLDGRKVELCIGIGGSIESIGEIRRTLWNKTESSISLMELASIARRIQELSVEERIRKFRLRPDRADVISPAATVLQEILQQVGIREILIPGVGVKDGLLSELAREDAWRGKHCDRGQVIDSALHLGRKYAFDEQHAMAVARLATQIFDQMQTLHELDGEDRLLLEVAALLHDIGHYIGVAGHHKHAFYLLQAGPIAGLSSVQIQLAANIARYHRKSLPRLGHENFRILTPRQRDRVRALAAILRVADAIDRERANRVQSVTLTFRGREIGLHLHGSGDMLLAKWALMKRSDLFEEVFGGISVEEAPVHRYMH
jgi:exopolyphosphatase/guanosine-5'-triphosphate,3'-diphosphate pyrophosphatase